MVEPLRRSVVVTVTQLFENKATVIEDVIRHQGLLNRSVDKISMAVKQTYWVTMNRIVAEVIKYISIYVTH